MTTPQSTPANRNKLLIIIGAAVVVLLAVIAIAVSSQAIRAAQEADAKASAEASASASIQAAAEARQKTLHDAEAACHDQVLKQHPTAEFVSTRSVLTGSDSYETVGQYKDKALYGTASWSMQYVCSTTKGSGTGWNATLTALGRQ